MKKGWWKYLVPALLALLQIGGSLYHNYFRQDEKAAAGKQRFEIMLANPSVTQNGDNEFHCYSMGKEDAMRFFYRMSGGNRIIKRQTDEEETLLTVFPNGIDSLMLTCFKQVAEGGAIARMVLPGKDGVRKRVLFYSSPKPDGN